MKSTLYFGRWIRVGVFLFLTTLFLGKPGSVRSESPYQTRQYTTNELYQMAFTYAQAKDYINAGKYLFAYTQRNPSKYANNVGGFRTAVDKNLGFYDSQTEIIISRNNDVTQNLVTCGKYQCDESTTRSSQTNTSVQPLPPPPDGVILCTDANYTGNCLLLSVGDYPSFPQLGINDAITSVMVGSQVKLTLCQHANLNSKSITFTSSDPNLTDNVFDSTYSWNDFASAARVQYR